MRGLRWGGAVQPGPMLRAEVKASSGLEGVEEASDVTAVGVIVGKRRVPPILRRT